MKHQSHAVFGLSLAGMVIAATCPAYAFASSITGGTHGPALSSATPSGSQPPSITVTPSGLAMSASMLGSATAELNIANAVGSDALTWSISARQANLLREVNSSSSTAGNGGLQRSSLAAHDSHSSAISRGGHQGGVAQQSAPWLPTGSIAFTLDDGSYEDNIGWGDSQASVERSALWLNRFSATGALNIDSVSILWPSNSGGTLVGKQINIVAYYDANADGDPTDATRLGADHLNTVAGLNAFETYAANFSVPAAGDVYVGFFSTYADEGSTPMLFPAAIDLDSISHASWMAANSAGDGNLDLGANDLIGTIEDLSANAVSGTWLIRATATEGGGGGPCTGPVVSWLSAAPAGGTMPGGANTNVNITATPGAANLTTGSYTAELCVTSNDPVHPLIAVPVSLVVTPAEGIFCSAFESGEDGVCGV